MTDKDLKRFLKKTGYPAEPNGCWLWLGAKTRTDGMGYGQFWLTGKLQLAHRTAYEHWVAAIPDGLTIDHKCLTRLCVNPWHLEIVSRSENVLRGEGPTAQNARKQACANGHPYTAENLIVGRTGKRYCRACKQARDKVRREIYRDKHRKHKRESWRRLHGKQALDALDAEVKGG